MPLKHPAFGKKVVKRRVTVVLAWDELKAMPINNQNELATYLKAEHMMVQGMLARVCKDATLDLSNPNVMEAFMVPMRDLNDLRRKKKRLLKNINILYEIMILISLSSCGKKKDLLCMQGRAVALLKTYLQGPHVCLEEYSAQQPVWGLVGEGWCRDSHQGLDHLQSLFDRQKNKGYHSLLLAGHLMMEMEGGCWRQMIDALLAPKGVVDFLHRSKGGLMVMFAVFDWWNHHSDKAKADQQVFKQLYQGMDYLMTRKQVLSPGCEEAEDIMNCIKSMREDIASHHEEEGELKEKSG